MTSIEELEKDVADIRRQLREAESKLHAAKCAAVGVVVGDLVIGEDGITYKVTRVEPWLTYAWVRGVAKRKDGTWGERERHLYSKWKKVQ